MEREYRGRGVPVFGPVTQQALGLVLEIRWELSELRLSHVGESWQERRNGRRRNFQFWRRRHQPRFFLTQELIVTVIEFGIPSIFVWEVKGKKLSIELLRFLSEIDFLDSIPPTLLFFPLLALHDALCKLYPVGRQERMEKRVLRAMDRALGTEMGGTEMERKPAQEHQRLKGALQ